MSFKAMLVFAVGVATLLAFCAVAFLAWLIWALLWDLYDHLMQQHRRIKNSELNAHRVTPRFNVGGDAK